MTSAWIIRRGSARSGFRYVGPDARPIRNARQLARIAALRVPPAWRDVHIASSQRAEIQAWGFDAKGRRQYRYHTRAVERGSQRKYHRMRRLARDLPRIRDALRRDLHAADERQRVAAAVTLLLTKGFLRVGSERYARENKTFGVTTLRKQHVTNRGDALEFCYRGKRGIAQRNVVVDRELAAFVNRLLQAPGSRLFRYRDGGRWRDLTARDVNDYLRRLTGVRFNAKDFRTWGGTVRVATVLAELGPAGSRRDAHRNVVMALRLVAAELGNTPAICRGSYVHPIVIARYEDEGETIAIERFRRRRGRRGYYPEERALLAFLDRHFPERRRRPRSEDLARAA